MTPEKNQYLLPITIVLAGALLAVAIFVTRTTTPATPLQSIGAIRPVSAADHMIGNPNAPVVIVEYSDIDCAYCKSFQTVLAQLMTEYGPDGKVAWVYRHFPLTGIHEHAGEHAEAAECVAEQKEAAFFPFIDALQQAAPDSAEFDPSGYPSVVKSLGLSLETFTSCMESDRMVERVSADLENALAAGGKGTPYTAILVAGKTPIPVTGALGYDAMKKVIEEALAEGE